MLIIQRIKTTWTKASRGGENASKRNTVPCASTLPSFSLPTNEYLLHDIRYDETNAFRGETQYRNIAHSGSVFLGPLLLYVRPRQAEAKFVWSAHECGAPERVSHPLFTLKLGEWGRFECNGRFGATSKSGQAWTYQHSLFNVAFVEGFSSDLFTSSEPTAKMSQMAMLR